jgi:hypothetical protein
MMHMDVFQSKMLVRSIQMSDKAKTSKSVATEASDILRDAIYGAKPKSVAGSALSQSPSIKKNPFGRRYGETAPEK